MSIVYRLKPIIKDAFAHVYKLDVDDKELTISQTKPEFDGDYTLVLFAFVKKLQLKPEELGKSIGDYLQQHQAHLITAYSLIKGFLSFTISDDFWLTYLKENATKEDIGKKLSNGQKVVMEYSSPNTNKPLHLGHLRNNFLGWSVAETLKFSGYEVFKTAIMNDRGIHICKSMISWQRYANGATPESTGIKGDHFVGDYYVKFGEILKEEVNTLIAEGLTKEKAEQEAPIMKATQQMLIDWENNNPEVRALWEKMNNWVYNGFNATYKAIGSDFDKNYYESNTYLLGKDIVQEGLDNGVFFKKEDGSVWIDLTADGLDEKLVLRKDGTSVYITQDLGLAEKKYEDFHYNQSIYVIADEQNYHMKVLKLILQKLARPYADGIYHLSYGMVELPSGRMKTREGTVVDADDLLAELKVVAQQKTEELGKVNDFNTEELNQLYETIALGALKFFLLRVDPKKRMIFNPEESIDIHGFTATFVQYTHARIKSILRKASEDPASAAIDTTLTAKEKELLVLLEQFSTVLEQSIAEHSPSLIAIYVFNVAKTYNTFYGEHSVLNAETIEKKALRLSLCALTANTIKTGMALLGIAVPERM